jgi:hypothetical protein
MRDLNMFLEVKIIKKKFKDSTGNVQVLWTKSGNQGNDWNFAQLELILSPPSNMIFFEAEVFDWKFGDIALDDIEYYLGSCQCKNAILRFDFFKNDLI